MDEELKPCPFCGKKAELFGDGLYWGVRCTDFSCIGNDFEPCFDGKAFAIEAWNRRCSDG